MKTRGSFLLVLAAVAALGLWLGPRPVHEPWVAEEVSAARLRALGIDRPAPWVGATEQRFDADGDGDLDLFAPHGGSDEGAPSRFFFQLNDGSGSYREIGKLLGPAFTTERRAVGSACRDLDGDGRMDLVAALENGAMLVLWNRMEQKQGRPGR